MIKSIGKNQHPKTLHNYYNFKKIMYVWKGFPGGSVVKYLLANAGAAGDRVPSLGGEDLLEEEMAIHSSIVAWELPLTGEPGRLQAMELQTARRDWATMHTCMYGQVLGTTLPWSETHFPQPCWSLSSSASPQTVPVQLPRVWAARSHDQMRVNA